MNTISINDIFIDEGGNAFRYLGPGRGDEAHVISMVHPKPFPEQWSLSALAASFASGLFSHQEASPATEFAEPDDIDIAGRQRRMVWIQPLVDDPDQKVLYRSTRAKTLAAHSSEIGVSTETLTAVLRLWWTGGQVDDSLLTKNYLKGTPKPRPEGADLEDEVDEDGNPLKPSRGMDIDKDEPTERRPYQMTSSERAQLQVDGRRLYLEEKTVTHKRLYRALMNLHYSYKGPDGKAIIFSPDRRPSRRQVTYALNKVLTHSEKRIRNTSQADFDNNEKGKTGSYMQHAVGVGHIYEIDSTIVDLWLVARDNRAKIIGKPTMYLVVDRYSRLIVGFHLSLDKPSWMNAMEAFVSIAMDKRELCARWGAEYDPAVWVAHKKMCRTLVADRGSEMVSRDSDAIAEGVKVRVQNMPARASALKPICEGTFKLFNVALKDDAAGYEPPANAVKRQKEPGYELDACLTLDGLARMLLEFVREHNRKMYPGIELDPELVLEGVRPIPAEIWVADEARRSGQLRSYEEKFLRMKLLPRKRAVVRQQGIFVNKLFYTCPEAEAEDWFPKARSKRWPVNVSYDRRSVDEIVLHIKGRKPIRATLAPRSENYRGLSVAEVYAVVRKKAKAREVEEHNMRLEQEREQRLKAAADHDAELTRKAVLHSNGASRTSNKKQVRQAEADWRRQDDARRASEAVMSDEAPPRSTAEAEISVPEVPVRAVVETAEMTPISQSGAQALGNLFDDIPD